MIWPGPDHGFMFKNLKNLNLMSNRTVMTLLSILFISVVYAQTSNPLEAILPMNDIDQRMEKLRITTSNMGMMVHADVYASLVNHHACSDAGQSQGRLNIALDWYNTRDETGKMMADMVAADLDKTINDFAKSSGFAHFEAATQKNIKDGKMWIYSSTKPCVNEITGPTGETEHFCQIRAFVFTGNRIMKIDMQAKTKAAALEQMLTELLEKAGKFDYASLENSY